MTSIVPLPFYEVGGSRPSPSRLLETAIALLALQQPRPRPPARKEDDRLCIPVKTIEAIPQFSGVSLAGTDGNYLTAKKRSNLSEIVLGINERPLEENQIGEVVREGLLWEEVTPPQDGKIGAYVMVDEAGLLNYDRGVVVGMYLGKNRIFIDPSLKSDDRAIKELLENPPEGFSGDSLRAILDQMAAAIAKGQTYVYEFASPAQTWTIDHPQKEYPSVEVYLWNPLSESFEHTMANIEQPSSTSTVILLSSPESGKVHLT
jgi:hypothetical protein